MTDNAAGRLVVVSGPSGAGKSTLVKRLFADAPVPLVGSVSATTRSPRPGEVDGVDYHFLSQEEFEKRRERGEFLECFQVFGRDDWYGTLASEVQAGLAAGKWVLLEIDVQGARAVRRRFPDAVTIFVHPGSLAELERRLRGRHTETEEAIQRRLRQAETELAAAEIYQYKVVNDDIDRAVREIRAILKETERRQHAR
ncbi:MAG: guanylate kinase [Pirellulales bacterium]|nr:guanylate kinase [Pirellulales bacterium]